MEGKIYFMSIKNGLPEFLWLRLDFPEVEEKYIE